MMKYYVEKKGRIFSILTRLDIFSGKKTTVLFIIEMNECTEWFQMILTIISVSWFEQKREKKNSKNNPGYRRQLLNEWMDYPFIHLSIYSITINNNVTMVIMMIMISWQSWQSLTLNCECKKREKKSLNFKSSSRTTHTHTEKHWETKFVIINVFDLYLILL